MTPSDLLTAAADRVRDLAAAAQRGPWIFDEDTDRVMVDDTVYSVTCYAGADHDDSQWIAALSPAVAPALEAVLRKAANDVRQWQYAWRTRIAGPVRTDDEIAALVEEDFGAVLALARVLVPEVSP